MEDKDATVSSPGDSGFWTGSFRPFEELAAEADQEEAERIEMWRAVKAAGLRAAANLIECEIGGELEYANGREYREAYEATVSLLRRRAALLDT